MTKRTFSMIKPETVKRGKVPEIKKMIEKNGFKIARGKKIEMTKEQAQELYKEHKEKPFYDKLINYATSGPVYVMVIEGKGDLIKEYRTLMGATNPAEAEEGTIRKKFWTGEGITKNVIHGADSPQSAERELKIFFDKDELA
ncbi:MAG: nucleoside-diphosphate kinase [Candidatus Undinarchaeales archaeon]